MPRRLFFSLGLVLMCGLSFGQYWQQEISYTMAVDLDDSNHQYTGTQSIRYKNNSPDALSQIFFHLQPNAFQPGSMMDVRSRTIEDPDPRVGNRIAYLSPSEQGFLHVKELLHNGKPVKFREVGTVLEVQLDQPIRPGKKAKFDLVFHGQVPEQVRRSGRNSKEGVAYSMTQWFPKMAEYDFRGWNAHDYVGREFHGVFGDWDVKITIDSSYTIGATGVLQNPKQIGKGYLPKGIQPKRPDGEKLTWHFKAEDVHDFAWAADKDYVHTSRVMKNGTVLHFFYKDEPALKDGWEKLPEYTERIFEYANTHFGTYPYPQYSVIQGGDGGMEYAMATLITGQRKFSSLVGVTVHEVMHSWYQMIMATNELLYPWMDEGFTTFTSAKVMSHLFNPDEDTRRGRYMDGYISLALSGKEEPMSKMADHYNTNYAYGAAAYNKGATFIAQLGYIMGDEALQRGLMRYYDEWKFKHPTDVDFIRVMEKTSGLQLEWYRNYMVNTTETIDYAIDSVQASGERTWIDLARVGNFPMPIDVDITLTDGSKMRMHIPLAMMRGAKPAEDDTPYAVAVEWPWTHPVYRLAVDVPFSSIESVEIDASKRLADVERSNNIWPPKATETSDND
jgi:hypothetical protein